VLGEPFVPEPMPLVIGTHLGLYEVTAHIGAGGMGEVYQAQDTKLGRKVALKILPEAFALDPDRAARFEREAKVLASLNHPHIAALYGFEEAGPNHFLVMELVEGETLADRLRRGPMPVVDALKVGHQIVEALEAAHEKGIIHRDLKPANVKFTSDDRVKVLDFGLARIVEAGRAGGAGSDVAQGLSPAVTNSPTLGLMATQAGVVLGTAAYMSPEQAKGLVADHRSDVFSFGVVLYEMLTGTQAFQAETAAEMMAAVLMREPDLTALPANLNLRLLELLRRCLDKQPKRRWQAVGDLRAELETAMAAPPVAPAGAPTGVAPKPFWRRAIPFATTAILSAAIAGGWVWWKFGTTTTRPSVVRFPIVLGEGQFANTAFRTLGISPDGTQVVYAANASLYVRVLSEVAGRPLAGTEQNVAGEPTFSPDGQSIAYVQASDRTLKKIAVRGGAAITLAPIEAPYSLSWSQDGILFSQPTGIMRVPSLGGPVETLVSLKPEERAYGPQMLPDGDTVIFTIARGSGMDAWDKAEIVAHSLKSGTRRTLVQGGSAARYVSTGHLVYALGGVLLALPFDLARLEARGVPVPVIEGVARSPSGSAQLSVSDTGSVVYLPGVASISTVRATANLASLDEKGTLELLKMPTGSYQSPRISPDGKRVLFGTDDGRDAHIWVYDLDGASSPRRLTFNGNNRYPIWSADGRRIVFQSDREGDLGIFWQPADGSGGAERLTKPDEGEAHIPESWSRKADVFSFSVVKGIAATLSTFSIRERMATPFSDIRSTNMLNSDFSPDGQWIAYTLRGGPSLTTIYVEPFPATGARYQISTPSDLGHHPVWSPNGKTLFYIPGALPLVAVKLTTRPTFAFSNVGTWPGKLPNNNPFGGPRNYDIGPDGSRFVLVTDPPGETSLLAPPYIQVIVNWFEELKARVPR
jgi:eukaryotic-like serine/threonine-protein kinase